MGPSPFMVGLVLSILTRLGVANPTERRPLDSGLTLRSLSLSLSLSKLGVFLAGVLRMRALLFHHFGLGPLILESPTSGSLRKL